MRLTPFAGACLLCSVGVAQAQAPPPNIQAQLERARIEALLAARQQAAPETAGDASAALEGATALLPGVQSMQLNRTPGEALKARAALSTVDLSATPEAPKERTERLRLLLMAGDWSAAGALIAEEGDGAGALYAALVQGLFAQQAQLTSTDVIGLAEASPDEPADEGLKALGGLLAASLAYSAPEPALAMLRAGGRWFGAGSEEARRRSARLLIEAGMALDAAPYLPTVEAARAGGDAGALNTHALRLEREAARAGSAGERRRHLRQAFSISLEVFSFASAPVEARLEAAERALSLEGVASAYEFDGWLDALFRDESSFGGSLLSRLVEKASQLYQQGASPDERSKALARNKRLARAMIRAAQERDVDFRESLALLAQPVIIETTDANRREDTRQRQYLRAAQLTPALPDEAWLGAMSRDVAGRAGELTMMAHCAAHRFDEATALVAWASEADGALAQRYADGLVEGWQDCLRPADDRFGYDPYGLSSYTVINGRVISLGGTRSSYSGAGATPLTRARQLRSLATLRGTLETIAGLRLRAPRQGNVVSAFTAAHSAAEVFLRSDIEAFFGTIDAIPYEAAHSLTSSMRRSLAGAWRKPATQRAAMTGRSNTQIVAEVERGYALAIDIAQSAIAKAPGDWRVLVERAALGYDYAEFLYGQRADLAAYAAQRDEAFDAFRGAAQKYADSLGEGGAFDATPFYSWFSAAMGASELGTLTRQDNANEGQIARIVETLGALPEDAARAHVGLFAQRMETELARLAPELKPRFLRAASLVIGDHPAGARARELLRFYEDVTGEVELYAQVDGPAEVGENAFGLRLSLRHTDAVSRETGGFAKYLTNGSYHPATGAQVDYRDDFENHVRGELGERFEVLAAMMHENDVAQRGFGRPGWRETPLGYFVIRAKDASVDRTPELRIDLDYYDGSGYVILPTASNIALIDARRAEAPPARTRSVEVALDDRAWGEGVLTLEVLGRGVGAVPPLERLLDLGGAAPFSVESVEDHGMSALEYDAETDPPTPVFERSWVVTLRALPGETPTEFAFPAALADGAELSYKRYSDVDIVEAGLVVALGPGGAFDRRWIVAAALALSLAGVVVAGVLLRRRADRRRGAQPALEFSAPERVTPLSAIAFLRRVERQCAARMSNAEQASLSEQIATIEAVHFSPSHNGSGVGGGTDIAGYVEEWARRTRAL